MRGSGPLLLVVAVLALAPAASAAARFWLGVAAGEVTARSALLWGHATRTGTASLQVTTDTDTHANLTTGVRSRTLEDGGPLESGFSEVVTGPAATATFGREIDEATGRAGTGTLVSLGLFKPLPPKRPGHDLRGGRRVQLRRGRRDRRELTVMPRDLAGAPVKDVDGRPCPPLVVARK